MRHDHFVIRALDSADHATVARFIEQHWGAAVVAAHGSVFRPADLPGFAAQWGNAEPLAGLLTYQADGGVLEIVTLDAVRPRAGIGTALVEAAVAEAARRGCPEIRLTTTNDNLEALRFYQRRGFRLVELRPGAVAQARQMKPEIPLTGQHGIPLRDELDLVRPVLDPSTWSARAPVRSATCCVRAHMAIVRPYGSGPVTVCIRRDFTGFRPARPRASAVVRCRKRRRMRYTRIQR
jgi:ribosomal protein S18 acetylase RimI-like enzyme